MQDSKTFLDNLRLFDKNFKKDKKAPNIRIRNMKNDFTMNVNDVPVRMPPPPST